MKERLRYFSTKFIRRNITEPSSLKLYKLIDGNMFDFAKSIEKLSLTVTYIQFDKVKQNPTLKEKDYL